MPPPERPLEPLQRERLGRLKAEWELAALGADVTRVRFRSEVEALARGLGIQQEFELDLERGVIIPKAE